MTSRTIDPEHSSAWKQGYDDGFTGRVTDPLGVSRHPYWRSDYFAGYEAGDKDRLALDEDEAGRRQECPSCGGTNTRRLTKDEHECFDCQETW